MSGGLTGLHGIHRYEGRGLMSRAVLDEQHRGV
jgi:hypothetical protein